ncbi:hypothetical protein BH10ACI2_BH10ACI2_02630 [soil metagenome]
MANQTAPPDEQSNDDNALIDGQEVRVNSSYGGNVHLDGEGKFQINGWPRNAVIESLDIIPTRPIDLDDIHPTIEQ